MARRVGLMTDEQRPQLHPDDRLLVEPLARREIEAVPVVWSEPGWRAPELAALVVRSTWDYVQRLSDFVRWLDAVQGGGHTLMNPADVVRWNLDKRYLLALERQGVPIIPTVLVERGARVDLEAILRERGWEEALVKPTVSSGAMGTRRISGTDGARAREALCAILERSGALIQPFQRAIEREGELSFIFFDRRFSHAVRKRPAGGDFRVQEEHGGRTVAEPSPAAELVAQARAVLEAVEGELTYARVDGVVSEGRFLLMELEVAEPSLYLGHHPPAAAALADAIARRL